MRRISIARSAGEMDKLQPAWEQFARRGAYTVFQDFAWNRLSAQIFADRESPYVVCAEDDNGAAIIPAAISRNGTLIVFLGETLFDYRTFLSEGDNRALEAGWQEIGALRQQLWVTSLPEPWTPGWQEWEPRQFSAAPGVLRSRCTAAEFADEHPRIRRGLRRLQGEGAELRRYPGTEAAVTRRILEQKARQLRDNPNNLFSDPRRIDFVAAALALHPGGADIYTLEQGSEILSALITLRDGNVRRFYNTYHDERWAKFSPGVALLYEVTRGSLEEGLDCDYMTGTQAHKTRLANVSVPLYRVDATPEQVAARGAQPALAA